MSSWRSDPEAAALGLITGALADIALGDRVLLAGGHGSLASALQASGHTVACWNRRVATGATIQPEPPPGPHSSACLRLPKSRDEQIMTVHQCLGTLAPDGRLIVYGGNDEGIRSFQKVLAGLGVVTTRATRGHGRVLELCRGDVTIPLRSRLGDWRQQSVSPEGQGWTSYPGLFAGGAPDHGTRLLLRHLPQLQPEARILDYGCGPGAIAAMIRLQHPRASITLLDNDAVALIAASENVAAASALLGDSLADTGVATYDLIVSNPPLHVGLAEDDAALHRLIEQAPLHLTGDGTLLLVVQRRIPLDRQLSTVFGMVDTLADDGRYRVWRARAFSTKVATGSVRKMRQTKT